MDADAAAAANARKEWSGALRNMPVYKANRQSGETWHYFRQSWMLWHHTHGINDIADVGMQKTGLCKMPAAQQAI